MLALFFLFCFVLIPFFYNILKAVSFLLLPHVISLYHQKTLCKCKGSYSLLLMNAVRFWVAPLIHQVVVDTTGYFEEMKERIQQN